jgi:hypothetical protein
MGVRVSETTERPDLDAIEARAQAYHDSKVNLAEEERRWGFVNSGCRRDQWNSIAGSCYQELPEDTLALLAYVRRLEAEVREWRAQVGALLDGDGRTPE